MDEEIQEEPQMPEEELRELVHQFKQVADGKVSWWGYLMGIAQAQVKTRENVILVKEEESIGDILQSVRFKGERLGIKLFQALPETILENLQEQLEDIEDAKRSRENQSNDDDEGGSSS